MDKNQAIEFFSSLAVFGIRPGLERTAKALDMLGLPRAGRFIHIAGTNGKGSAAAFASSILTEAGLLTGTYTSPYVFSINERFGIGRGYISDADLGSIAEEVKKTNGLLKAESGESLTEFEAKTVAAFIYFARKKTDWNVIECGMGGGSDATNVITPRCSVIVSVGLDHTEWLGSTVREIAREKAGIIKPGVPCVTGAGGEALEEIDRKAEKAGSRVYALGRDFFVRGSGPFRLESDIIETEFEPSLQGAFQPGNAAISAVAAALCERLSPKDIQNGIKKAFLPGRFQRISRRPDVYLDGAHNGPAAEALARSLEALGNKKLILVIGMLQNHSPRPVLRALAPLCSGAVAVNSQSPRAVPAEDMERAVSEFLPCKREKDVQSGLALAKEMAGKDGAVIVTGSFYTIGEVKS